MADVSSQVDEFVAQLRRRQVAGSYFTAKRTVELLRQVISQHKIPPSPGPHQAQSLLDAVRAVGRRLGEANPTELAVGNIVRRILHIIREEDETLTVAASAPPSSLPRPHSSSLYDSDSSLEVPFDSASQTTSASAVAGANRMALAAPSLHNLLESPLLPSSPGRSVLQGGGGGGGGGGGVGGSTTAGLSSSLSFVPESEGKTKSNDKNARSWRLKHGVIEGVNELLSEVENFRVQVAEQAAEHIHQDEIILAIGDSRTLLTFFKEAKKKRAFQVVVPEGSPRFDGHPLASSLATQLNLPTTLVPDSSVLPLMARMHLVVTSAHAVLANGGVVAPVGCHLAALAAKKHAVPFVVLAGVFKLCPLYPHGMAAPLLNDMRSPASILDVDEFSHCLEAASLSQATVAEGSPVNTVAEDGGVEWEAGGVSLDVINPAFDYIPPDLVSLLLTDAGGHQPSYVYRLVSEYYSSQDISL